MSNYSFPKRMRLLTPMSFNFVFQHPQRISLYPITILARLNSKKYPRIGFAVSKKNVKQAHERNRIKRLMRENFRLHQHELPKMDFVILVKKGIMDFNNKILINILEKLWYHYYLVKYSDA